MPTTGAPERIWMSPKSLSVPGNFIKLLSDDVEYIRAPVPLAEDRVEIKAIIRAWLGPEFSKEHPRFIDELTTFAARVRQEVVDSLDKTCKDKTDETR